MNTKHLVAIAATMLAIVVPGTGAAQALFQEDFTGATTNNNWFFFNGACLTAGTGTSTSSPGQVPGCAAVFSTYYGVADSSSGKTADANMTGGYAGYLGSSTAPTPGAPVSTTVVTADPITTVNGQAVGQGALRFTNGYPYGYHENGAIVSAFTVPSGQGLEITFKTTTYLGDKGGAGKDGADGISFYLLDGCMPITGGAAAAAANSNMSGAAVPAGCTTSPNSKIYGTGNTFPAIGAWGGSLAYTCSNANPPYHGLTGAYIGLGIDEYGNFLNGTSNTLSESGTSATGDNTASGGGYQPGRIGLRGAGSISWQALTTAYGTYTGSTSPYYPASLATTCTNGGTYNSSTNTCGSACTSGAYNAKNNNCVSCPTGTTLSPVTGQCGSCTAGGTYDPTTNTCSPPAASCTNGATYDSVAGACSPLCATGTNYNSGTNKCNVCSSGQTFDLVHALAAGKSSANPCAACSKSGSYSTTTGTCTGSGSTLTWNTPNKTSNPNTPISQVASVSGTVTSLTSGKPLLPVAVQKACSTGHLYNYNDPVNPVDVGAATLSNAANTAGILDYAAIPGAYSVLSGVQIANETATTRSSATPIFYDVKITQDGLLSFSYSTNGSNYTSVIKQQKITDSNGPLPASLRFGFAGSTGGSTNVHEIECFKAGAANQSASSTTVNQKQSAKITPNVTQAYFAYYDPSDNTGRLTANYLATDTANNVIVNSTANWDAQCVLTGASNLPNATCATTTLTTPVNAQGSGSRVMLSFDGSQGIPFQFASLSAAQQAAIDNLDASQTADRVGYLRGDRGNEVNSVGVGEFRARDGILGDIIDSSPAWVGPPASPYTQQWKDALHTSMATPENSNQYAAFTTTNQARQNVVYAGSNDGFLHGFRTGTFDKSGTFSTATNDGQEVIAYMPAAVVDTIHTVTQNASGLIDGTLDFSNTQYVHNFFVDGPPGTGDLYYANAWHTWLVGGLGAGGSAIYALDVTDPSKFSESNASSVVIGEWNQGNITCVVGGAACSSNLGQTYGTPQIRRLHDGNWGVIFGNGLHSSTGDAGIYVMVISQTDGSQTFYYLSTGTAGTGNGIAYATPADFDGDHITDYVYAGDLNGNIWRFDLTSTDETKWAASTVSGNTAPTPLFTTPGGQPITTQVAVGSGLNGTGQPARMIISFGTGQKFPVTTTGPATYATGQQTFYGVWDWNMSVDSTTGPVSQKAWNSQSNVQYAGLTPGGTGLSSSTKYTLAYTNLVNQQLTIDTSNSDREMKTTLPICWTGSTTCKTTNTNFGWYLLLPGTGEQLIYNPQIVKQSITFNTIVPANNIPTSCTLNTDTGFTYDISLLTGGAFTSNFPSSSDTKTQQYHDSDAAGVQTNATGTSFSVTNSAGEVFLVYQTVLNTHGTQGLNLPPPAKASRVTWTQLR
jgi:type IV pilus assembly protein PilY1